jgi:hypothetical protein
LARYLDRRAETVLEVSRSLRGERRLRGKDDPLDAIRAGRSALAAETSTLPRAGQRQEALRLLLLARRSAVDVRRLALVQLRSVIVTAPDDLAELRALVVGGDAEVVIEVRDLPELRLAATIRHVRLVDPEGITEMMDLARKRLAEGGDRGEWGAHAGVVWPLAG